MITGKVEFFGMYPVEFKAILFNVSLPCPLCVKCKHAAWKRLKRGGVFVGKLEKSAGQCPGNGIELPHPNSHTRLPLLPPAAVAGPSPCCCCHCHWPLLAGPPMGLTLAGAAVLVGWPSILYFCCAYALGGFCHCCRRCRFIWWVGYSSKVLRSGRVLVWCSTRINVGCCAFGLMWIALCCSSMWINPWIKFIWKIKLALASKWVYFV